MYLKDKLQNRFKDDLHLKELFKGGSVSFSLKLAGLALGYVFSIVVARTLGAESFGIYSLCLTIVTIASIFARFGFDTTILRLNAEYKSQHKEDQLIPLSKLVFKVTLVISLVITLIIFLTSEFIAAEIFKNPGLTSSIKLVSFAILPFSLSLIFASALKGFKQITKAVFIEYISKFAFMLLFLVVGFLLFDLNKNSVVPVIVAASWTMLILSAIWYRKEISLYHYNFAKTIEWKGIFRIALPLILASSVLYLKGWIDTIYIGIFMTEKEVGIYNVAQKLANLTVIPLVTINTIAAPKFAENILSKYELKRVLRKTTKLIFIFATPILVCLILFSGMLLKVFGPEFIEAETVLVIVAVAAFVNAIFGSFGYLLQMTGHHVAFQNSIIFLILLSILLNYLLIPVYGLEGAAVTTIIVNFVWYLIVVLFSIRKILN